MITQTNRMFLDIPAAAAIARISTRHFRRLIGEHQIPIAQIGRKFFILGKDLNKFMRDQAKSPKSTKAS